MNMHSAIATDSSSTPTWDQLLDQRNAAKRAYDLHHATVWTPRYEELERTTPRPDLHFEIEALNGQIARYFMPANDLHTWDDHWSPVYRRKAAEVRDAWLAYRANSEALDLDAASAECDRLCDTQCSLEDRLLETPAPHAAALMWKLDHLFGAEATGDAEYCAAWCMRWINALMDDARRILGEPANG